MQTVTGAIPGANIEVPNPYSPPVAGVSAVSGGPTEVRVPMLLRASYAMSGTDIAYGARTTSATARCSGTRSTPLRSYALATRCPVLTSRMVLCQPPVSMAGRRQKVCLTASDEFGLASIQRCVTVITGSCKACIQVRDISLRTPYAMSGTDAADSATCLRAPYELPGADSAYQEGQTLAALAAEYGTDWLQVSWSDVWSALRNKKRAPARLVQTVRERRLISQSARALIVRLGNEPEDGQPEQPPARWPGPITLRSSYAMSGTDVRHAVIPACERRRAVPRDWGRDSRAACLAVLPHAAAAARGES
eukprot:2872781-Rhodomonas_salina.1